MQAPNSFETPASFNQNRISRILYFHYAGKAHKCHSQQAGCNQSNRRTLQTFRNVNQAQLFANTCKNSQRKSETKRP